MCRHGFSLSSEPQNDFFLTPTSVKVVRAGKFVPDISTAHFFVCGPAVSVWDRAAARERGVEPPPRFLESALKSLETLGVTKDRITRESYG